MRRVSEFKGYRSVVEYDPLTGQFVTGRLPEIGINPQADEAEQPTAEILPFPQAEPSAQQKMMTG